MRIESHTKKTVNPMTRETEYRHCDKCGREHTEVVSTSEGLFGISCTFKAITGRSPENIHEARNLIHSIIKYAQGSVELFKQSVRYESYGVRTKEIELTVNPELSFEDFIAQND